MKKLIAIGVLLVALPHMAMAATWDDMIKEQQALSSSDIKDAHAEDCNVSVLGKNLAIPPSLPAEYRQRLQKDTPSLESVCPGLAKHRAAIGEMKFMKQVTYENSASIEIIFAEAVPQYRIISGTHCFFAFLPGDIVSITKSYCKSLCLGKDMSSHQEDLRISLR